MANFFEKILLAFTALSPLGYSQEQKPFSSVKYHDNNLYKIYQDRLLPLVQQLIDKPNDQLFPVPLHLDQSSIPYLSLSPDVIKHQGLPMINFAVAHEIGGDGRVPDHAKLINFIAQILELNIHVVLDGTAGLIPTYLQTCLFYNKTSDLCRGNMITENNIRQFYWDNHYHINFNIIQQVLQKNKILLSFNYINPNATYNDMIKSLKKYFSSKSLAYSKEESNYYAVYYTNLIYSHTTKVGINAYGFNKSSIIVHPESQSVLTNLNNQTLLQQKIKETMVDTDAIKLLFRQEENHFMENKAVFCQYIVSAWKKINKNLERNHAAEAKRTQIKSSNISHVVVTLFGAGHYSIKNNEPNGFFLKGNSGITFWEGNTKQTIFKRRHSVFPDDYRVALPSDLEKTTPREKILYVGLQRNGEVGIAVFHKKKLFQTTLKKEFFHLEKSKMLHLMSGTLQGFLAIKEEIYLTAAMHDFAPLEIKHYRYLKDQFCSAETGKEVMNDSTLQSAKYEL